MKPRILSVFILIVMVIAFALALTVAAQERSGPSNSQATPPPTIPLVPTHVPYDPFERLETLPAYPYNNTRPPSPQSQVSLTQPAGIDLDVTYISRAPLYTRYDVWYTDDGRPYLRPGTENDQRWPAPGEVVTFTVHIINKGTIASGTFTFKWFIDGSEVHSGTHGSLAPGEEGTETYRWAWAHTMDGERLLGKHTVRFTVDPADAIPETYESNNNLEDRTDALSLFLALTPALYTALETPIDFQWPFSAEDWFQKQIAAMNAAFARSIYTLAPNGIIERVRLDKILVVPTAPPPDLAEDGGFFIDADDRFGSAYYDPTTDVSGGLIHELMHQLGIIDLYNLDTALENLQVVDRLGLPVQTQFWSNALLPGVMNDPRIRPLICDEHTAHALNSNKGYRRGYYGEYLFDVPARVGLRVLDDRGDPAPGVTIRCYQRSAESGPYAGGPGTIDATPEISGTTDSSGLLWLPNRPVGAVTTTATGHTLRDNPFGVIDVIGRYDVLLLDLSKGRHQEYQWLNITQFNLLAWRGEEIITVRSHVPAEDGPLPPARLSGWQEQGQVKLTWEASPSAVTSYNVYCTPGETYAYTRIVTGTRALTYVGPYDYRMRAVQYAVTATDAQGRESGFSNLFYAFQVNNPWAVAIDSQNRRIILDPQNYYGLFLQSAEGTYLDTLDGYYLPHQDYSKYLCVDSQGHLIVSHPGDAYDSRHSVRVTDENYRLRIEFGERGTGQGQFNTPAGVAVWGQPCTLEGPLERDAHTLLLLHLDGDYQGAEGEIGTARGTRFVAGKHGQAVLITGTATLTYPTAGNFSAEQGAVEFWYQPWWSDAAQSGGNLFDINVGPEFNVYGSRNHFLIWGTYRWEANVPTFFMADSTREGEAQIWTRPWERGQWYHLAVTWKRGEKMHIYLNGELHGESNEPAPIMDVTAPTMYVGSRTLGDWQARGAIDELRISDIPRIGNSDTCTYRILVADSGNHRVQAFDVGGNFISAYGSPGSGPGQFNDPQGLTVDDSDVIIVADSGNNRLQVLSFDGTTFGFLRTITAELNGPTGIAAYGTNRIIVADTGNNKVKVLDAQGNLLSEYGAPNDGYTGAFNQPRGVVADRSARIIVADTDNKRVVTILDALPVWSPTSVAIAGPTTGVVQVEYTFTATVSPMTATLPITYVWQATATEQVPVTHAGGVSDTVTFTWSTSGAQVITVTATNAGGRAANTQVVTINPIQKVYLPVVLHNNP